VSRWILYALAVAAFYAGLVFLTTGSIKRSRGEQFLRGYAAAVDSARALREDPSLEALRVLNAFKMNMDIRYDSTSGKVLLLMPGEPR
jgi:hypothetical protein